MADPREDAYAQLRALRQAELDDLHGTNTPHLGQAPPLPVSAAPAMPEQASALGVNPQLTTPPLPSEVARGLAAGIGQSRTPPPLPASNSQPDLATWAGGTPGPTGFVSPGGANANGVLASRELPGRRLSEAEYNSMNGATGRTFPSFMTAGANSGPSMPPRTGSAVLDNLAAQDAQITAMLGERPSFSSHGFNATQAAVDWEHRRSMLTSRFGGLGNEQLGQGNQDLERTRMLGVPGGPIGSMAVSELQARSGGLEAQREARMGAQANQLAIEYRARNPEASGAEVNQHIANQLGATTDRVREVMGGSGTPPTPGGAAVAGSPPPPPTGTNSKPWSHMERILDEASGYNAPTAGAPKALPKDATVGVFLNRLETNHPGSVAHNWPAISSYIGNRFGEAALQDALSRSESPRQVAAPDNILQGIARSIPAAMTYWRQLATGPNEEELGLSGLGNFLRNRRMPR